MQKRQSCSGLVQSTVCYYWVAVVQVYTLEKTPLQLVNMSCVLGVTIASDLSLVKHVGIVCVVGFFQASTTSTYPTITRL